MSTTYETDGPEFERLPERLHLVDLFDLQRGHGMSDYERDWHQEDKDNRAQGMDQTPEPPEDGRPPLSLDVIGELLDVVRTDGPFSPELREALRYGPDRPDTPAEAVDLLLGQALPQLLAEARRLGRLPKREEFAVTDGHEPSPAAAWVACETAEKAERLASQIPGGAAWVRSVVEHEWREFGPAPF